MGRTFIQEAGTWQIYNPVQDTSDVQYMDETLNKVMSGYRDKINQAREEIGYRKELLKEKEMRDKGVEYRTYARDENDLGKKVDTSKEEARLLKDLPQDVLDRDFEYYNPRDHFELKLPSKDEITDKNMLKEEIRETIDAEIQRGNEHIVNPEMMNMLGMSEDKIELVRKRKEHVAYEEKKKISIMEMEKNMKKIQFGNGALVLILLD